jgi:hypothetical protein
MSEFWVVPPPNAAVIVPANPQNPPTLDTTNSKEYVQRLSHSKSSTDMFANPVAEADESQKLNLQVLRQTTR